MLRIKVTRGQQRSVTLQARKQISLEVPGPTDFNTGMPLRTQVFRANDLAATVATPLTTWYDASLAQFTLSFLGADTLGLELGVFAAITSVFVNNEWAPIFEGQLEVLPDARASANLLPDLVTANHVLDYVRNVDEHGFARLPRILSAASMKARRVTDRVLSYGTYDEMYSLAETRRIVLLQSPLRRVRRVLSDPTPVLTVSNNFGGNQQAFCYMTSTGDPYNKWVSSGLAWYTVSRGVQSPIYSVLWDDAPTVGQAAAAVRATGNGWNAVASSSFVDFASAELRGDVEAEQPCYQGCSAQFLYHSRPIQGYRTDPDPEAAMIELDSAWAADAPYLWPYANNELIDRGYAYPVGVWAYRVVYEAGWKTITGGYPASELPEDLAEAVCRIVKSTLAKRDLDPNYKSRSMGSVSHSLSDEVALDVPTDALKTLLSYRDPGRQWTR
jgi:hypothetical protein